jgi:hypothetical protein
VELEIQNFKIPPKQKVPVRYLHYYSRVLPELLKRGGSSFAYGGDGNDIHFEDILHIFARGTLKQNNL